MIRCVDHINIVVSDLERSVRFYTEVLGFRETRRAHLEGAWIESIVGLKGVSADVVFVVPEGGEPRFELIQYHMPQGATVPETALPNTVGLRHVALRVSDIELMVDRIRRSGACVFADPVTVPGSVVKHDAGHKSLCYFRDPDGVILELAQYD
ncbi:MAG: hypothetical protein AMXMBFR84_20740 [Candidatus Hydrogenedentota bacterium]